MLAMNPKELSSRYRSPFARRILIYLRSFDPVRSETWFAKQIGITKQTMNAWMYAKSEPKEEHLIKLAQELGCTIDELRDDIAFSRNWTPPYVFAEFIDQVRQLAVAESWPDIKEILPWLDLIAEIWQDPSSLWINVAQDTLTLPVSPHTKAQRLAHVVRLALLERTRDLPSPPA